MTRLPQRYGHISPDARREAMESMNAPRPKRVEAPFEGDAVSTEKDGGPLTRCGLPASSRQSLGAVARSPIEHAYVRQYLRNTDHGR